jgi:hypothetical protein
MAVGAIAFTVGSLGAVDLAKAVKAEGVDAVGVNLSLSGPPSNYVNTSGGPRDLVAGEVIVVVKSDPPGILLFDSLEVR